MSTTACIVVAAGQGSRMGGRGIKQFRRLRGVPLISYCLKTLHQVVGIGAVVLVVPPNKVDWARRTFSSRHGFRKVIAVVAGGHSRQESVELGLAALPSSIRKVLIHDAVRPFVSVTLIKGLLKSLKSQNAVVPVCPIADTLKRISKRGDWVVKTVSRAGLYGVQTPQGFQLSVLRSAFKKAKSRGWMVTDESMLLEKIGRKVAVIPGDPANIKITSPIDWAFAEQWVRGQES